MPPKNQSTAYDFARFSPRENNVVPLPKKKSKGTAQIKRTAQNQLFTRILVCAVALILIMAWIFSRVQLTEITAQINTIEKQLDELKSEQIRMEMEFEAKMSAKKIEEYAVDVLGMKKIDQSQVEYIYMNEGDRIVLTEDDHKSWLGKMGEGIARFLSYGKN